MPDPERSGGTALDGSGSFGDSRDATPGCRKGVGPLCRRIGLAVHWTESGSTGTLMAGGPIARSQPRGPSDTVTIVRYELWQPDPIPDGPSHDSFFAEDNDIRHVDSL